MTRPLVHAEHCGSMLRGAFGHELRALACRCNAEVHRPGCLFQQIFEPPPPPNWPLRYRDCPPAYVISPPPTIASTRQHLDFAFTLLGPTLEQRALIWQAWQQAAARGLGEQRIAARLLALGHENILPGTPEGPQIHLRLTSPLLIKRKQAGQPNSMPVKPDELQVEDLLLALHRRLDLALRLYGAPDAKPPSLEEWLAPAASFSFVTRLQEHHYSRRSNRQQKRMPLYGLSGNIHIGGPLPQSLRGALALGQWLHIGGKTALGLGGYRVMTPTTTKMRLSQRD